MPPSAITWAPECQPLLSFLLSITGRKRLAVRATTGSTARRKRADVWIKLTYDVEKAT